MAPASAPGFLRVAQQQVEGTGASVASGCRAEGEDLVVPPQPVVYLAFEHRRLLRGAAAPAVDDEGAAHAPAGTVAQELVEDALGVGRGQAVQVQFQPHLHMAALKIGKQALLHARAGEEQVVVGLDLRLGQDRAPGLLAQLRRLGDRDRGRTLSEGFGLIGLEGLCVFHGVAKQLRFRDTQVFSHGSDNLLW